jgi:hypothetical protein
MNKILKEAAILLIVVVLVLSSVAVTANTAEEQIFSAGIKINENTVINQQTKDIVLKPNCKDRSILFIQEPNGPNDPGRDAYQSATNLGHTVYDNFWDVLEPICDVHWWGFTLYYDSGWKPGNPDGMKFDITIWTDNEGQPGNIRCYYQDITYTVTGTGIYYTWTGNDCEMYYFEADLDESCDQRDGWVEIQSTFSPNDYSFAWMNSDDGDQELWWNTELRTDDVSFILTGNDPPSVPSIYGPVNGDAGEELTYTFSAVDPDGDDVRFIIEWGDINTDITYFVPSGADQTASHTWASPATYTITAKAEDTSGNIGPEATFTVTIPRDKAINNPILNLLQSHPNLFPLLQLLLHRLLL